MGRGLGTNKNARVLGSSDDYFQGWGNFTMGKNLNNVSDKGDLTDIYTTKLFFFGFKQHVSILSCKLLRMYYSSQVIVII